MQEVVSITSISSVSPLGTNLEAAKAKYQQETHCFKEIELDGETLYSAPLTADGKAAIASLRLSNNKYQHLDDTVLFAIYAARNALKKSNWNSGDTFGINIGSSRGATILFEKKHQAFLEKNEVDTLASPTTTLGNISSWVAHDLQNDGIAISHSITCSTGLHSLLNGIAWIKSGMASKFLVGASEAALTAFTFAQMRTLRIYSQDKCSYPSRPLDFTKKSNTMILGEAASIMCLEEGKKENALAIIEGIGYATEILKHSTSISADGQCFQKSMRMAMTSTDLVEVDLIIMHAPGTVKGDLAEMNAINKVFGGTPPAVCSNKWKVGHTFASSGLLSIEWAILLFQNPELIHMPYLTNQKVPKKIEKILVNAVGFGGNAVSVLLTANG